MILVYILLAAALVLALMSTHNPISVRIFSFLHGKRLTCDHIHKNYNSSQESEKILKEKCDQEIKTCSDLPELRSACENRIKEIDAPGNRIDVVLPFFLSVVSFMVAILSLRSNQISSNICMLIFALAFTPVAIIVYSVKTQEKEREYLALLINEIDEKLTNNAKAAHE